MIASAPQNVTILRSSAPFCAAAVYCFLVGCAPAGSHGGLQKAPGQVGVVVAHPGDIVLTTELTGRITPVAMAEVRPQVDGIVQARDFNEGAWVRAGQVLYTIDPASYQVAVAQAQATLAGARAASAAATTQAARYRSITDADALSAAQVDTVNATAEQSLATVQRAQASLAAARLDLLRTHVMAPISGRIGRSLILPGALVSARQVSPLAIITQEDAVNVDVEVPDDVVIAARRAVAQGRTAPLSGSLRLTLPDGSVYPYKGTIAFIEPTVGEQTGMAVLRARFPNPAGMLMPGMFVRVQAPLGIVHAAVAAPQTGVQHETGDLASALVVDADDRVARRTLTVAQAQGDRWIVTSGLHEGDRVIVEGTGKVEPGEKVRPVVVAQARAA